MDYRLKIAYEQMLAGNSAKQTSEKQPKNLTEAYKTILTERVALYAKTIGQETVAPEQPGLKSLGIADDESLVRNTISSITIKPAVAKLLSAAGNWEEVDDFEDTLKIPIAMYFANAGLTSDDVTKLVLHKPRLTTFSNKVKSQTPFNVTEQVIIDLEKILQNNDQAKANLPKILDYVFSKKPKIKDVGVGMGEVALTILTDCQKGKVGDLHSPSAGDIEVKSSGGRVAPKDQVNLNYASDLAEFLKEQNVIQKTSKYLHNIQNSIAADLEELKDDEEFDKVFTDKFVNDLNNLITLIGNLKFEQAYQQSIIKFPAKKSEELFKEYQKRGYIAPLDKNLAGTATDIESNKRAKQLEISSYITNIQKYIKNVFETKLYKKREIQKIKYSPIEYALSKKEEIRDISSSKSLLEALQEFYFTDYGLTLEQKAKALTLIVSKPHRSKAEKHLGEIRSFFEQNERRIAAGDRELLQQMVFAMQTVVYADGHFNYLFVVSKHSKMGMGMLANSFENLIDKYIVANESIEFSCAAKIDANRGGSAIQFPGEKIEEE